MDDEDYKQDAEATMYGCLILLVVLVVAFVCFTVFLYNQYA